MTIREVKVFETEVCDLGIVSVEKHTHEDQSTAFYVIKYDGGNSELLIDSQEDYDEFKALVNKF